MSLVRFLSLSAILSTVSGHEFRRLLVDGFPSEAQYTVALYNCETVDGKPDVTSCLFICSGALIAPSVVLTAGHCLLQMEKVYGQDALEQPVENLFVVAAVANINFKNLSPDSFSAVTSIAHPGYGKNKRFPLDNDIALVFLSRCLTTPTIAIATRDTVKECDTVTVTGYGPRSKIPRETSQDPELSLPGIRNDANMTVHADDVCRAAIVDRWRNVINRDFGLVGLPEAVKDFYVSDQSFCFGGDTSSEVIKGDSGGPVVSGGRLVGVSSSGSDLSPAVATKVAPFAR
jgi:secreted trypsin-like serine protease